jgi:prephenate dehydrogenase
MTPEAHDAAFAAVSHLPHMIAYALMNAIKGQEQAEDFLALAGPGFRDFSRIAASDPQMWRDVLMANREEVLAQAKHFQRALHAIELTLAHAEADKLESLIDKASQARARWRMATKLKG